jgi:hypothetical protein
MDRLGPSRYDVYNRRGKYGVHQTGYCQSHERTETPRYIVPSPRVLAAQLTRQFLETKDGKKAYDPPPHSKEMLKLNRVGYFK